MTLRERFEELVHDYEQEIYEIIAKEREACAKIAERGPPPGGVVLVDGSVLDPGVVVTGFQKWIAQAIRKRGENEKG